MMNEELEFESAGVPFWELDWLRHRYPCDPSAAEAAGVSFRAFDMYRRRHQ